MGSGRHNGKTRSIEETTLDPPLGAAHTRLSNSRGRAVAYERVADYWGKAVNVNIGRDNFDELRFEYRRRDGRLRGLQISSRGLAHRE